MSEYDESYAAIAQNAQERMLVLHRERDALRAQVAMLREALAWARERLLALDLRDERDALRAEVERLRAERRSLVRAARHLQHCDMAGTSIEFRCEQCVDADRILAEGEGT